MPHLVRLERILTPSSSVRRFNEGASTVRLMWTAGSREWTLGCMRRAIYSYLFARSHKGRWILYLTHPKTKAKTIENALSRYYLIPDEGPSRGGPYNPYVDSKRFYQNSRLLIEQLMNGGERYLRCEDGCWKLPPDLIQEWIAKGRQHIIRIQADGKTKSDVVLLNANGTPTILYKNALRQKFMHVTHVVCDELRQSMYDRIYRTLGFEKHPIHLPIGKLIVKNHGKLCPRKSHENRLEYYNRLCYEPIAVINWLVGGYGIRDYDRNSIYTLNELVERFDSTCFNEQRRLFVIDIEELMRLDKYMQARKNTPDGLGLLSAPPS